MTSYDYYQAWHALYVCLYRMLINSCNATSYPSAHKAHCIYLLRMSNHSGNTCAQQQACIFVMRDDCTKTPPQGTANTNSATHRQIQHNMQCSSQLPASTSALTLSPVVRATRPQQWHSQRTGLRQSTHSRYPRFQHLFLMRALPAKQWPDQSLQGAARLVTTAVA